LRVGPQPWGDYATIEAAIGAAAAGDELWVLEGTYALTSQILVDWAVAIYGGFGGDETTDEERDWVAHPTILDGQNVTRCLTGSPCIDQGSPDPAYNARDETRNDMGDYRGGDAEAPAATVSIAPASSTEGDAGTSILAFAVTVAE
jgi:hypothetical protein